MMRRGSTVQLAMLVAVCLSAPGCEDDDSPTGPTPITSAPPPSASGATQVRGTERLGWNQTGETAGLRFRAYVDDRPVELPSATCNNAKPDAECSSPLPSLTNGVHTLELVTIQSGRESGRSAVITLEKVSTLASTAVALGNDSAFKADVVATGVRAPAQLSWLPDGRLLLSDATGRIRVVRPGEPDAPEPALEAGTLSDAPVPMALASHPEFARNRFVYISLLENGRADHTRLRLVRLREVADTLGEAATLFEAPVTGDASSSSQGPRMAFGPDRLLYVMLPPGLEFVNEPAASTPTAAIVRLTDEGRAAPGEPLSGVVSTPLGLTWHPTTGALWVMSRGENGDALVRSIGGRERVQAMGTRTPRLLAREGTGSAAGTLFVQSAPDDQLLTHALLATRADGSKGLARLALPARTWSNGTSDRVGDVVAGDGGTLFVATSNGLVDGAPGLATDVVVRLRPVTPSTR